MNLPNGDLVLSAVSIRISPNLIILGVKFDSKLSFEDHVSGIFSRVSQGIGILRLVKRIFVDSSVLLSVYLRTPMLLRCYYAFVLLIHDYRYPVWGPMQNVTFSFSSARCIWWPGFASIGVTCCVINVLLLF